MKKKILVLGVLMLFLLSSMMSFDVIAEDVENEESDLIEISYEVPKPNWLKLFKLNETIKTNMPNFIL